MRHFVLSYAEEDRPAKPQIIRDAEELLKHFCARFPQPFPLDRLARLLVLHREAAGDQIGPALDARKARHRFALHLFAIEYDLLTGKRLQLYYAPAHKRALGAWLQRYNRERGYACPSDPTRARRTAKQWDQRELNSFAEKLAHETLVGAPRRNISPKEWADLLRPHCRSGAIECRARDDRLVAKVRLPAMRSRTTLIRRSDASVEVRAAKAIPGRKQRGSSDSIARLVARYIAPPTTPALTGNRAAVDLSLAMDVLTPVKPGAAVARSNPIRPETR